MKKSLLRNDLLRAKLILRDYRALKGILSPALTELQEKITRAQDQYDAIKQAYLSGVKALDSDNPEEAIESFRRVLMLCPDHEKARAGLQGATRYQEWRDNVQRHLDAAQEARCRGDFETARERCKSVLLIAPDNSVAQACLSETDDWIEKRSKINQVLAEGDQLYTEQRYEAAIRRWEMVRDIDGASLAAEERIGKAKARVQQMAHESDAQRLLRDAQRAFDNQDFEQTISILQDFPTDVPLELDARFLRKKAQDMLERVTMQQDIEARLIQAAQNQQMDEARRMLALLIDLAPESKYIAEYRDTLLKN